MLDIRHDRAHGLSFPPAGRYYRTFGKRKNVASALALVGRYTGNVRALSLDRCALLYRKAARQADARPAEGRPYNYYRRHRDRNHRQYKYDTR